MPLLSNFPFHSLTGRRTLRYFSKATSWGYQRCTYGLCRLSGNFSPRVIQRLLSSSQANLDQPWGKCLWLSDQDILPPKKVVMFPKSSYRSLYPGTSCSSAYGCRCAKAFQYRRGLVTGSLWNKVQPGVSFRGLGQPPHRITTNLRHS